MFRSAWLGLVVSVPLVCWSSTAARAADDDDVIKKVDGELLKELAEEEGYRGITIEKVSAKIHLVIVKFDGKKMVFFCDMEHGMIHARFAIGGTNANARKINNWNESKKFFKAHLDKDGDPVMTYDLVVKHGVTRKTIKEFISLNEVGLKAFLKEVCE